MFKEVVKLRASHSSVRLAWVNSHAKVVCDFDTLIPRHAYRTNIIADKLAEAGAELHEVTERDETITQKKSSSPRR